MEIAKVLKNYAQTLPGREQLAAHAFAEAMEIVPLTLTENAGLDPIDTLSELRARHEKRGKRIGVGVYEGKIQNMADLDVYEPLAVKKQIIKSATEATCMILKVDDIIASNRMKTPQGPEETDYEQEEF